MFLLSVHRNISIYTRVCTCIRCSASTILLPQNQNVTAISIYYKNVTESASSVFQHKHTIGAAVCVKETSLRPLSITYLVQRWDISFFFSSTALAPTTTVRGAWYKALDDAKRSAEVMTAHRWCAWKDVRLVRSFSRRFRDARWTRSPQWARGFIQTACRIAVITCPPSISFYPHSHDFAQMTGRAGSSVFHAKYATSSPERHTWACT